MEALKRQRASLKGQITRICTVSQSDVEISKAKALKYRLEHYMQEFERVQNDIDALYESDESLADEIQYRSDVETLYYDVYAKLLDKIDVPSTINHGTDTNSTLGDTVKALIDNQNSLNTIMKGLADSARRPINITKFETQTRLPEIKLPEFTGKFDEWVHFRDLFVALVQSKESISGIEKFEHLQTRLKGEASSLIKHLPPSNENFDVAWNLVKDYYDKPQFIMIAHLDNIFEHSALKGNSLSEIKLLFTVISENINALRALKQPVESWNVLLVYVLTKKLDAENKILWIRKIKEKESPSLLDFTDFLKERINEFESLNVTRTGLVNPKFNFKGTNKRVLSAAVHVCLKCKKNHMLYQCSQFRDLPVASRLEMVRLNKICVNCLRGKHNPSECKFSGCKLCNQHHNTLLHEDNAVPRPSSSKTSNDAASGLSANASHHTLRDCFTLLPTAMLSVMDASGQLQKCRALLDSGSQSTLITEACAQRLKLKRSHARIPISGIGQNGNVQGTRGAVSLIIRSSHIPSSSLATNAYILSNLTNDLPSLNIPKGKLLFFDNLMLADPNCHLPNKIDILLGSDVFFEVLTEGKIIHPTGSPIAHNTIFGWVISGNTSAETRRDLNVYHNTIDHDLLLRRFWEFEDLQDGDHSSHDSDAQIENHFIDTHYVQPDGRYVVNLPFKSVPVEFGDSRSAALKRLNTMEKRFARDPDLKRDYVNFMREYEELGHMAPVPTNELNSASFYLPHHAVLKPSSTTTKLRVVFDASCKSSNGISLNDCLLVGPTIQNDLITSLIKFRKSSIAVKADITKMYRQVMVNRSDVNYQRIIWREDVKQEPRDYQLLTVTYGTASASFLATRVLKQVGIRSLFNYPHAGSSIINDFYVDDYMSGFSSCDEAIAIKNEICTVLNRSGMELRKWASNSSDFLADIDPESRESSSDLPIGEVSVKTLGLVWDTRVDHFKFSFQLPPLGHQITKREVLSDIARIFDPMGWLSPAVVKMKIFMKHLWVKGVGWDTYIPPELYQEWADFRADLHHVVFVGIPRWIQYNQGELVELHGFADASESAYAAAIYSRISRTDGSVYTTLICAKTRVAPVKPVLTVPRLELCGALLLSKLFSKVKDSLGIHNVECFAYTDSSTVLHWIQGYPRRRNVFADNRISQIAARLPSSAWHYVRSAENPADCATRGLMPMRLPDLELWWKGPLFIQQPVIRFTELPNTSEVTEENGISYLACSSDPEWDIFNGFSSLNRLLRVCARCIRLFRSHGAPKSQHRFEGLSPQYIKAAKIALVKLSQQSSFAIEIGYLRRSQPVPNKSGISRMNPFIDEDEILRVGGRLENANIPFEQKHPVILHKEHRLTKLIVNDCHISNLHAGIRQMTYLLSLDYFIVGSHHAIKRCVYQCVACMRQRAIPYKQQMADLPKQRVEPGMAFNNTGVDYAGPFSVTSWKGRGAKQYKVYLSLFVCMATKALHLEAVTELSSAAFIAALRRFVARRGKCHTIFSDNGTNFVGANQQLREWSNLLNSIEFQDDVCSELTTKGINWCFIPPYAPHFGGIWEAGVKTVKYHLRRILGNASVTYEEFSTILCQIEACANSRPLCTRFEGDIDPITPAHFLILRPMTSVPDRDLLNERSATLRRWQYVQRTVQDFWKKWSNDYLSQLQKRNKWSEKSKDIQINDVVVIKEENLPPCQWLIGRVTKTYPGRDGLIRVATVMTAKGETKRAICKLCPLFVDC